MHGTYHLDLKHLSWTMFTHIIMHCYICFVQTKQVTTSLPEEEIDILETGTVVVITFTKTTSGQSVSVGKISVIACGAVGENIQ